MSAFSDIASIDGNSEEFSRDEFDIFTKAIKNSNEYNDLGYADGERIKTDIYGNHYISAEKWENDSSVNGCLYNIIKNSYNFDELDISFSDAYSVLLSAIAEKNGISDVNLIYENQEILLVDPYEALGIEKPNAEDIVVEVPVETKSPSDDEGSDVGDDTAPSTGSDPVVGTEPVDDTDDKSKTLNAALSDIYAELEKRKSETETEAESKTGFGAAWNAIKGVFGSGTKGELSEIEELEELYESVSEDPSEDAVAALYEKVFGVELNLESVSESAETAEELMEETYEIDGVQYSVDDVIDKMEEEYKELSEGFSNSVDSQGIISKGISWLNNNLFGIGTTKNMTQAQIDELGNQIEDLKNAKTSEEFAAAYKSITGESLTEESISKLFSSDSSVLDDTTAAESTIDYENTTDNIKNTAIAVGIGCATVATGGIAGAVALGVGVTVGVNALDAGTQTNGKGVVKNLYEYATTDMVKDACLGAINGLTGKLGNIAGEKVASAFATKSLGRAASTAVRLSSEYVDGSLDAGLSSAFEYVLDAAAGENGNFRNSDGSLIDENGNLAFVSNFFENFDAGEMAEQVAVSSVMGGVMSVGMKEVAGAISKGIDSVKSGDVDDVKIDTNSAKVDTDDVKMIDTDSAKVDTDSTKADTDSTKADTDSTKADTDSTKADTDSTKADTDSTKADTDSTKADTDSTKADTDSTKADTDSTKADTDSEDEFLKKLSQKLSSRLWNGVMDNEDLQRLAKILGVNDNDISALLSADIDDKASKTAYKKLLRQYHPDTSFDNKQRNHIISEIINTLYNINKK